MRFASFEWSGRTGVAEVRGEALIPLRDVAEIGPTTALDQLYEAQRQEADQLNVDDVRLLPVVPHPGKVFCVGLNYADHIAETGRDKPTYPVLFPKFASSLLGPRDDIALPPESEQVDWEGELAVVVGRAGRRISRDDASEYVAGFSCANDITMRDYQHKTHQWVQGKAWDASTPIGPYLVTADEVDLPGASIRTLLNGTEVQRSDLSQLVFDVPTLISMVSEFTALQPGDIILTGTPGGVGYFRTPQLFLQAGDTISVDIAGVGRIDNRIVPETPQDR